MVNTIEINKIATDINTDETKTESTFKKIEVDAEKLWSWFEREIGLEHPAAKSLNVIAPKPVAVEPSPESLPAAPASDSVVSAGAADTITTA